MRLTLAFLAALALAGVARANDPCPAPPVTPEVGAAQLLSQLSYSSTTSYGTTTGGGCCGTVPAPGLAPGPVYTPPCAGAAPAPGYSPGYAPSYTPGYAPAYGGYSRALAFTPAYTYRRSFDPGFAFAPVTPVRTYYAPALAPVVVRRPVVGLDVSPFPVPATAHGRVRFRGRLRF